MTCDVYFFCVGVCWLKPTVDSEAVVCCVFIQHHNIVWVIVIWSAPAYRKIYIPGLYLTVVMSNWIRGWQVTYSFKCKNVACVISLAELLKLKQRGKHFTQMNDDLTVLEDYLRTWGTFPLEIFLNPYEHHRSAWTLKLQDFTSLSLLHTEPQFNAWQLQIYHEIYKTMQSGDALLIYTMQPNRAK